MRDCLASSKSRRRRATGASLEPILLSGTGLVAALSWQVSGSNPQKFGFRALGPFHPGGRLRRAMPSPRSRIGPVAPRGRGVALPPRPTGPGNPQPLPGQFQGPVNPRSGQKIVPARPYRPSSKGRATLREGRNGRWNMLLLILGIAAGATRGNYHAVRR